MWGWILLAALVTFVIVGVWAGGFVGIGAGALVGIGVFKVMSGGKRR